MWVARKARRSSIRCPLTASRSSVTCNLQPVTCRPQPVTCSPVVESVNTAKNYIPNKIKTVTPKKVTVSPKKPKGRNHALPLLSLDEKATRYYVMNLKAASTTQNPGSSKTHRASASGL
jgi:hypothetical protein